MREDCRIPRRSAFIEPVRVCASFWTAPVLRRLTDTTPDGTGWCVCLPLAKLTPLPQATEHCGNPGQPIC